MIQAFETASVIYIGDSSSNILRKYNTIRSVFTFTEDVVLPTTYLNDVRFDFRVGKAGYKDLSDTVRRN